MTVLNGIEPTTIAERAYAGFAKCRKSAASELADINEGMGKGYPPGDLYGCLIVLPSAPPTLWSSPHPLIPWRPPSR